MKKSIEAPNDDAHNEEKYLLDEFMEWYSLYGEGTLGQVAKYEKLIGEKYLEFLKEHTEYTVDYPSLNYCQINELDKSLKDPSYEIDVTLWK